MIAIIDYGVGNLFSLQSSFKAIGEEAVVSADPSVIASADKIILPGVGAFEDAIEKLKKSGLDKTLRELCVEAGEANKPLMGICLGMQLLFEKSFEYGEHEGLGFIKGEVKPLLGDVPSELKIPHMGWNALKLVASGEEAGSLETSKLKTTAKHPIFKYIDEGDCVYFVHSYHAVNCDSDLIATAEYGRDVTAAVAHGNIIGCQFHPEKSGEVGLKILKAFCEKDKL